MARGNIVVGIDFSEYSDVALEQANWLAGRTEAGLVLVHVDGPSIPSTSSLLPSVQVWEKIIEQRAIEQGAMTKALTKKISDQGTPASYRFEEGSSAEQLASVAADEKAAFVVVGTHGLTGVKFFLLGSTAQGVVRHARCNVLVARKAEDWGEGPRRILVATDFSEYADEALRTAIALAPDDATVDVVHCWQVPVPVAPPVAHGSSVGSLATLATDMEQYAEKRGAELIKEYSTPRIQLNFQALAGSAGSEVLAHAKGEPGRYDLIVTGSHGRRGFRRFFLGSVAERIVRHAPCSVLVVHRQSEG